jgi:hypothetical protein
MGYEEVERNIATAEPRLPDVLSHGLANLLSRCLVHTAEDRVSMTEVLSELESLNQRITGRDALVQAVVVQLVAGFPMLDMSERQYDVFLSHAQHSGQDQAGKLKLLLTSAGLKVWYDMAAQDLTSRGMEEGVSKSRCVLCLLTEGMMSRPFCNNELRWGKLYGCKIVGVVEKDTRHGCANFGDERACAPEDLKHILDDVEFLDFERRDYKEAAMVEQICLRLRPADVPAVPAIIDLNQGLAVLIPAFTVVEGSKGTASHVDFSIQVSWHADGNATVVLSAQKRFSNILKLHDMVVSILRACKVQQRVPKPPSKHKAVRGAKRYSAAFLETRRAELEVYLGALLRLAHAHDSENVRALLAREL